MNRLTAKEEFVLRKMRYGWELRGKPNATRFWLRLHSRRVHQFPANSTRASSGT